MSAETCTGAIIPGKRERPPLFSPADKSKDTHRRVVTSACNPRETLQNSRNTLQRAYAHGSFSSTIFILKDLLLQVKEVYLNSIALHASREAQLILRREGNTVVAHQRICAHLF
jgi:hypothetical protein